MARRRRCLIIICIFPIFLCLSYVFCVYSIHKRNTKNLYGYDLLHRSDLPVFLGTSPLRQNPVAFKVIEGADRVPEGQKRGGAKLRTERKERYVLIKGDLLANEEYIGGIRTDVDRTEERKKNKKIKKLKRGLKEKCKNDAKACEELKLLQEEDEKRLDHLTDRTNTTLANVSATYEYKWSAYADRGFTIVGKEGSLMRRLPHILIIGAKKAGTRALLEFLRLHPSVTAASAELHFFDRYFYRGPAWYRKNLPPSLEGQLTVEKTPAYFMDRDVPPRVKEFLPLVKLLIVVRDPVVRAISDFTQSLSNRVPRASFRNLVLKNTTSGLVNVGWGPVRGGLYARHYQRWRKYFPATSFHVVSGEGLVSDPAGEMAAVQEFLNLQKVINNRHFYFNATKGFPCVMKSEKNGKHHCLGFSKGRVHPQVDKDTLQILRDFYRPFNAKFYRLVGRDFGWP